MKDIQRTLYLAAIIGLAFLLVLKWHDFKEAKKEAEVAVASSSNAETTVDASSSSDTEIVTVKTDVLNIDITTYGGDMVRASLNQFQTSLDSENEPYLLLHKNKELNKVYTAASGLVGADGPDESKRRASYTVKQPIFELKDGQEELVVDLNFSSGNIDYIKRFTFKRGEYLVNIEYIVANNSDQAWRGQFYGEIKRYAGLPVNEESAGGIGMQPYIGAAITTQDDDYKKISFSDITDKIEDDRAARKKQLGYRESVDGGWLAMIQHYFITAWIPNKNDYNNYALTQSNKDSSFLFSVTSPEVTIAPGKTDTLAMDFYVGPKDIDRLSEISNHLDLTIDFGWLWWIAKPLFYALSFIYGFVGNWGVAIIVLTFFIKLLFFPLSAASYRSMAKMRKLGPKMKDLKDRFGDDRQKMSQEMMKLYKKEKVNPVGGCLPILIQMPVFIALYYVLMESVELRHAPFMLWLNDLSTMDPYFILPLIMGLTMYIQQQLNPTPPDPTQAKIMKWMPVVFTFMFLWFPSGLVLYWVVNNTLSIIQQYVITKQIEAKG